MRRQRRTAIETETIKPETEKEEGFFPLKGNRGAHIWPTRLVYRGGNLNNGSNAGVGYVNVNNDLGNRNANIGSRLGTKLNKVFGVRDP